MKIALVLLLFLVSVATVPAQSFSSAVDIVTTYSQNGKFYLKSVPFDNESPSLRGTTSVYENGNATPRYVFERGFDSVGKDSNNLTLSNNGETIFYAIPWAAQEDREGLRSVTIYRNGKILKSYTETEITGCDEKQERCSLVYSNFSDVLDKEKSNWGTGNYKRVFKDGVDQKERFLFDFPIFSFDDMVYLTDSKKNVHIFDLKDGSLVRSDSFDNLFEQIKDKGRFNQTILDAYNAAIFLDFPKLTDGRDTDTALAAFIGMKAARITETKDDQYKKYGFKISSNLSADGSLEIEDIEFFNDLPKARIMEFFQSNRFDYSTVPKVFGKWNLGEKYFYFRKSNDVVARQEKEQEKIEARREYEKRLTLESINGIYIPKDLGECFVELDRLLSEIDKKEMLALPKRDDMIQYHMGLGMWMRNNWRLWGGSRLQRYFMDREAMHPDDMSHVILVHYHDWLHGNKDTWKDWEKKSPTKNVKGKQQ